MLVWNHQLFALDRGQRQGWFLHSLTDLRIRYKHGELVLCSQFLRLNAAMCQATEPHLPATEPLHADTRPRRSVHLK